MTLTSQERNIVLELRDPSVLLHDALLPRLILLPDARRPDGEWRESSLTQSGAPPAYHALSWVL
ncbi:hypothetical protein [Nguyenibacter vanlangensis]|uniref:Uncharacterized protein n=1 Tax=Nguyenibacter vanlangensis TaxID=1216886 RepID=A0A7Y7IWE1_9PROT|nr:hypothetical protein [Nguyenibacter vanlangensis]NVN11412.1 hypothetical protein [Nguyenibacter vanlangensis]